MNKRVASKSIHEKNRLKSRFGGLKPAGRHYAGAGIFSALVMTLPHLAYALNLYDGSQVGNNMEINLTTTVSYAGFLRVGQPSASLVGPGNANGNDGDANFRHGIVNNQIEVLPVLDIRDGNFGAHFSGEAFLNTVYLQGNQNNQPSTFNSIYSSSNTSFTSGTRNVNGQNARLLDAFVFGRHEFADGQSVSLKVGRQTLFWGQSLLFPSNGISAGQAPIDIITAVSTPNAESQQVFLPVGQAVLTYRPGVGGLTLQAYYQFEWEHDNFNGAGAYFNGADYINAGGQSLIVGNIPGLGNAYLLREKDLDPPHQDGQFGLSVQDEFGNYDVGLYGLRWDAKAPEILLFPGGATAGRFVPGGISAGAYELAYPTGIQTYGASLSTNVGPANVAGEVSGRRNMPLLPNANTSFANYPVGDVLYAQASAIYLSPGIPLDPGGISFAGEVAMNHLLCVTSGRDILRPYGQATAAAFSVIITPQYYNVLPNLNVTVPIGIGYNFLGRSEVDQTMQHGTGNFNVGVTGTYRTNWSVGVTYQDYLGKPSLLTDQTTYNDTVDRSYVSLNLQHTF